MAEPDAGARAVTLQGILQTAFVPFAQAHRLPPRVWRAAHAVMRCRTAALGGHVRRCPAGHVTAIAYNACRHRACPRCGRHRLGQWLDAWQQAILPTDHFHVIFTLPSELHDLWRWNRRALTELLFRAVRETLLTLLADPRWLGAQPGVLAALHTEGGGPGRFFGVKAKSSCAHRRGREVKILRPGGGPLRQSCFPAPS